MLFVGLAQKDGKCPLPLIEDVEQNRRFYFDNSQKLSVSSSNLEITPQDKTTIYYTTNGMPPKPIILDPDSRDNYTYTDNKKFKVQFQSPGSKLIFFVRQDGVGESELYTITTDKSIENYIIRPSDPSLLSSHPSSNLSNASQVGQKYQ